MNWIVLAALIVVVALVFNLPLLIYSVGVAAAVFFLTRWIANRWSQQVTGYRRCDVQTARIGERIPVSVKVTNPGPLAITWLLVEDFIPEYLVQEYRPRLEVTGARLAVAKVRSGGTVQLSYHVECLTRGFFQIGPTVVETGDFFGMQRRYRVIGEPNYVLVYPKVIQLEGYDIQSRRPIGEVVMTHRLFEDPTRISGVRQYQHGDPLTRIHWRATARTGTLQCKQYQPSSMTGATIVVDFNRGAFDPRHEPYRSELAITAAASIAAALHEMGQQFGLISNAVDAADRIRKQGWLGDWRTRDAARASASMRSTSDRLQPVVVSTRKSNDQIHHVLESLARLELSDGLPLPQMLLEATQRMPADASVIVIVCNVTLEIAVALGLLRRQGFAVTAIVNSYDQEHFARVSGRLIEHGVVSLQLRNEESIAYICQRQMLPHV